MLSASVNMYGRRDRLLTAVMREGRSPYNNPMPRALILALFLFALAAPAADAQNAPPGNSGVDEYLEAVPAATGNRPVNQANVKGGGTVLTAKQQRALDAEGVDGKAAARVAERFGAAGTGSKHKRAANTAPAITPPSGGSTSSNGDSIVASLSKTVLPAGGNGGLGPALPIILVTIAAAGAGAAVARHRRTS